MLNLSPFFPDTLRIKQIAHEESKINIQLVASQENSICPMCKKTSARVHSHYDRTLMDLPILGGQVCLDVAVRKFFCDNPACSRSIFTERFTSLIAPYARRTERLKNLLGVLAFGMNCMEGSKVTGKIGIWVSHDSLLRIIMNTPVIAGVDHKKIGVDDWAYRKRHTYGTLVCDLETHAPIALFPERTSEALEQWLQEHRDIEIVSRDRASAYSKALEQVCPNAIQVADRFHLLNNLIEALKKFVKRTQEPRIDISPNVEETETEKIPTLVPEKQSPLEVEKTPAPEKQSPRLTKAERRLNRRNQKRELVREVKRLYAEGVPKRAITRLKNLSKQTVSRYLALDEEKAVTYSPRPPRLGIIMGFLEVIKEKGGQLNKTAIFKLIKTQGFKGCYSTVTNFIRSLGKDGVCMRKGPSHETTHRPTTPKQYITQHEMTECLWSFPNKLEEKQKGILNKILENLVIQNVYALIQEFRVMVSQRKSELLEGWLEKTFNSKIPELQSFVSGIRLDFQAVFNSLVYEFSNGLLEGHVNRVKTIKRMMYGRAKLDLLRQRVLYRIT